LTDSLYLVDANLLIARLFEEHEHHALARQWLDAPGLQWALCPWSEAGFLRFATRPGRLTMSEASGLLEELAMHAGYRYVTFTPGKNWSVLTEPFFKRLHGHKQVTDAYLLGQAIEENMILATFDKRLLHLAGEHTNHILILG